MMKPFNIVERGIVSSPFIFDKSTLTAIFEFVSGYCEESSLFSSSHFDIAMEIDSVVAHELVKITLAIK